MGGGGWGVGGGGGALGIEKDGDVADADGRPPHSFEAIVEGGLRAHIAEAIWLRKPAGIATTGNVSYTHRDSQGEDHVIEFSRPVDVPMLVTVTVTALYAEEDLPEDAAALIRDAVVETGEALGIGVDVIGQRLVGDIFAAVPGLAGMTVTVDRVAGGGLAPTEPIASDERARFTTANVTVAGL